MTPNRLPHTLRIIDGMSLILAMALGVAWSRVIWRPEGFERAGWLRWSTVQAMPYLTSATFCLVAISLRSHGLARLARQPGLILCLAAIASVSCVGAKSAMQHELTFPSLPFSEWLADATYSVADESGVGVIAAYLTLIARGRWLPRSNWLDRSAFAVALLWMATIIAMCT